MYWERNETAPTDWPTLRYAPGTFESLQGVRFDMDFELVSCRIWEPTWRDRLRGWFRAVRLWF